ncbi:MAG: hypothetical protein ACI8WT_004887 [Clostridium sp.]
MKVTQVHCVTLSYSKKVKINTFNRYSIRLTYILEGIGKTTHVASLSPYLTRHIKRFGDYVIDLKNIPNAIDMAVSIPMKQDIAT